MLRLFLVHIRHHLPVHHRVDHSSDHRVSFWRPKLQWLQRLALPQAQPNGHGRQALPNAPNGHRQKKLQTEVAGKLIRHASGFSGKLGRYRAKAKNLQESKIAEKNRFLLTASDLVPCLGPPHRNRSQPLCLYIKQGTVIFRQTICAYREGQTDSRLQSHQMRRKRNLLAYAFELAAISSAVSPKTLAVFLISSASLISR